MSVAHLSPVWRSTRTSGNSILSFFPQYCSRNSHKTCRPAVIPGRSSGVPASRVEGACDAFACRERLLGRSSGMSVARCFALMAERGYGAADYGRHYSSSWIFFRQNHLVRVPSLKIVFRCELPFPCRLPQPQPQDTTPLHTLKFHLKLSIHTLYHTSIHQRMLRETAIWDRQTNGVMKASIR